MSMPKIEKSDNPIDREQSVSNLIESVALMETGLSHIINAEGEKIQKVIKYDSDEDVPLDDILKVNESVERMVGSVSKLEMILQNKLDTSKDLDEISGPTGLTGPAGKDGVSPNIGDNGNWWIGDTDTGISAQGPQGEPGPEGPGGPFSEVVFGGLQVQLENLANDMVPIQEIIVFDNILVNDCKNVIYDNSTGEFTITKAGKYYVSWWLSTSTSLAGNIQFSIMVNGNIYSTATSDEKIGQISGSAYLLISDEPSVITLTNTHTQDIRLSNSSVQGGILILELPS